MEFFGRGDDGAGAGDRAEFGEEGGIHDVRVKDSTPLEEWKKEQARGAAVHLEMPNLYQNEQRKPLVISNMGLWMARLSDTDRDSWLSRAVSLISPPLIRLGLGLCLYTN